MSISLATTNITVHRLLYFQSLDLHVQTYREHVEFEKPLGDYLNLFASYIGGFTLFGRI